MAIIAPGPGTGLSRVAIPAKNKTSTIEIILVGGPFVLKSEQEKDNFSVHSKIVCMGFKYS